MPALPFPGRRALLLALAYVAAFVVLDWASYIRPLQGLNITPWNPQPALAVALLMRNRRGIWLVWAGLLAAELVVRGVPDNASGALAATIGLTLTYAAMAQALVRRIEPHAPFRDRADLLWFTGVVTAGSLLCALLYVLALSVAGPGWAFAGAVARYWVGDSVGLVVTLPVLLVALAPARRPALAATLRSVEWWASAALTCVCLAVVFTRGEQGYFKYFYLLLLPVVWASARFGLAGAVASSAFTQLGLIGAAQLALLHELTLFELQALMAAATLTALLLGVLVDERDRAAAELRSSLRFAAAGQMAAALAHELSQPLTALRNYAQACRLLAHANADTPAQGAQLAAVVDSLSAEAQRAGEVVKRLRDFFRTGATSLRRVGIEGSIQEAVQAHQDYAHRLAVALHGDVQASLPPVWIDPIQIAVVLRNLVANALESAAAQPGGEVRVTARQAGAGLLVEVHDSGPGIDAAHLQHVFEAGAPSAKQGGMGVGLAICRGIVEAHGGKLWAVPGPGGRFSFTLPIEDHGRADPAP